jgi:DNA-binding XRE family transcriptional regulator
VLPGVGKTHAGLLRKSGYVVSHIGNPNALKGNTVLHSTHLQLKSPAKLRAAIKAAGLTQLQVAHRSGFSKARIVQLVNGISPGTPADRAVALAKVLRLPVTDLFEVGDKRALQRLGLIPTDPPREKKP